MSLRGGVKTLVEGCDRARSVAHGFLPASPSPDLARYQRTRCAAPHCKAAPRAVGRKCSAAFSFRAPLRAKSIRRSIGSDGGNDRFATAQRGSLPSSILDVRLARFHRRAFFVFERRAASGNPCQAQTDRLGIKGEYRGKPPPRLAEDLTGGSNILRWMEFLDPGRRSNGLSYPRNLVLRPCDRRNRESDNDDLSARRTTRCVFAKRRGSSFTTIRRDAYGSI